MPEVAFVMSSGQGYPLRELAGTVGHELELQAVPSSLHLGGFPDARPDRVYVLLDPCGYVAIEGEQALPDDSILKRTIFLCVEPPPADPMDADEYVELLQRAGAVFVIDQRSAVTLQRLGITARLMRPGYSMSIDHFDPRAPRPIDVMFVGRHTLRRTRYLSRAARVLARYNCLLHLSDDGAASDPGSFLGEDRWGLLAQTKVVINLHCGDDSRLEWRRVIDAIHAGAVVVTEHSSGIRPLVPGEHLLVATADSLPFVAEALLRDEQRLAAIRAQAHERLSTWIPYALPVSVLRAAVVELVGEPVRPGVSLGTRRSPPAPTHHHEPPPAEHGDPTEAEGLAIEEVEVAQETPGFSARPTLRVTVIMALGGDRARVIPSLDSLARSRFGDWELIVATGASDGDAREDAERWMAEHPWAAASLIVTPRPGVGAARNAALRRARGAACLILDPGQQLYPRCLDMLTGTLEAMPDVAFVYPIQEVIGAPDAFVGAGGDYLMSFRGWEPRRLRRGNYIHAPALIRTDRLRRLGGFAADPRLAGFEDYDLWSRVADRGWRGRLVAQGLARRSESGSSRALESVHPPAGPLASALTERAPRLMSGVLSVS